jgi:glycosyltransferase involved in cell wall biosynthesis
MDRDRLRVLVLHNAYRQRGGEDRVVELEYELLRAAGHSVILEHVSNDQISGPAAQWQAFLHAPYAPARKVWMRDILDRVRPDIVHVHNFFPLLSPSVHEAAADAGVAVVQTLHNYRPICASATLSRNGKGCEKCLDSSRNWALVHRCYQGSLPASLALVRMQNSAFSRNIWSEKVHRFIALTAFGRDKFIAGGLPADRVALKPNFAPDHGTPREHGRRGALFVGRLSREKGVDVLLRAWRQVPDCVLTVVGEGPDLETLMASAPPNVRFLGRRSPDDLRQIMGAAQLLVLPSLWPEGFPLTLVEAFAAGLPVLGSRLGAMAELIDPGKTGELFTAGDADDLAARARALLSSPRPLAQLGQNARSTYEKLYTPEANLRRLEAIYAEAMALAALTAKPQSSG